MSFSLNFLKGVNNDYIEVQRLTGFLAAMSGIIFTGIHEIRDHAFNIIEFGTGMGLLITGIGIGTAAKAMGVANAAATQQAAQGGHQ